MMYTSCRVVIAAICVLVLASCGIHHLLVYDLPTRPDTRIPGWRIDVTPESVIHKGDSMSRRFELFVRGTAISAHPPLLLVLDSVRVAELMIGDHLRRGYCEVFPPVPGVADDAYLYGHVTIDSVRHPPDTVTCTVFCTTVDTGTGARSQRTLDFDMHFRRKSRFWIGV